MVANHTPGSDRPQTLITRTANTVSLATAPRIRS